MSMLVSIKDHVLERWSERVDEELDGDGLERIRVALERDFKNGCYKVIEPGHNGRLIVNSRGNVFVIYKTSSSITVYTVYGSLEDYNCKCRSIDRAYNCYEIYRWEKQQRKKAGQGKRK